MAGVTRKFSINGVQADSTMIPGLKSTSLSTGTEVFGEPSDGAVYRRFQSIVAQKPTGDFSTTALATAITQLGIFGKDIASLTAGFSYYLQKHLKGATRAAGASHRKYNITEGIIVPRQLDVTHQQDATMSFDVIITYDGSNDPFVITDSVALPTAAADIEKFTLGAAQIGGVTLDHIRQFTIDFGINAVSEGADSEIWDRFVSMETIEPSLTLRGIDPEWLKAANIPLGGKEGTHANTAIYLRKRARGSSFVPIATAEHIKFTASGLVYVDQAFDGSGSGAVETSLVMPLDDDGVNAPIIVDTAIAHP